MIYFPPHLNCYNKNFTKLIKKSKNSSLCKIARQLATIFVFELILIDEYLTNNFRQTQ